MVSGSNYIGQCQVCRNHQFDIDDVYYFQVTEDAFKWVEKKGKRPWAGIRLLCIDCITTIGLLGQ